MKHILKKTFRVWWSVLLATGVLCGCASTTQVLPRPAEEKPTANKSLVTIERPSSWREGGLRIEIYDNHTFVGKIGPGGKLVWLRDPGVMVIQRRFSLGAMIEPTYRTAAGLGLAAEAGKSYRYKINVGTLGGPGVSAVSYLTEDQSPEGSLVFFRVLAQKSLGKGVVRTVKIINVQTGKPIQINIDTFRGEALWVAFDLPLGEYYVSTYEVDVGGYQESKSFSSLKTYKINAEFSVTKPNVGIYAGDISLSGDRISIRQDSTAAREFLKQNSLTMPYTEAIMRLN